MTKSVNWLDAKHFDELRFEQCPDKPETHVKIFLRSEGVVILDACIPIAAVIGIIMYPLWKNQFNLERTIQMVQAANYRPHGNTGLLIQDSEDRYA